MGPLSPWHGASSGCGWREGLQIWRVAANILSRGQPIRVVGPPASVLGVWLMTPYRKNFTCYEMFQSVSDLV
jgi:hypothetical protein